MSPSNDAEMRIANRVLLQSGIAEKWRTYHSLEYCICVTLILTQHKTKIHSREKHIKIKIENTKAHYSS